MGRASRRKRANGGTGFFRREHVLAAISRPEDSPPVADTPPAVNATAAADATVAGEDNVERAGETPPRAVSEADMRGGDR